MGDFVISLLDICIFPMKQTSNLLVFVPTVSLCICVLFLLIRRLSHLS